jgi:hypothetical protein
MRRSNKSTEERIQRAEKIKLFQEEKDKEEAANLNSSFPGRFGNSIRLMLYVQIFVAVSSFFFYPFANKEVIRFYTVERHNYKGTTIFNRIIRTETEKEINLSGLTNEKYKLAIGDTVLVLRNFFYKVDGVSKPGIHDPYHVTKKLVWCFIWIFALPTAIFSSFFKRPRDLKIKNRLTFGLLILIVLYFFL